MSLQDFLKVNLRSMFEKNFEALSDEKINFQTIYLLFSSGVIGHSLVSNSLESPL